MTTSTQGAPTYNSEGHLVWKPGVGAVFDKAGIGANNYAGIITALNEGILLDGGRPKAYPHNFAGIIAAIKDLEQAKAQLPPVEIAPIPPGSEIDGGGDLNIIVEPEEGALWFDTRQGRLFVAIDNEWWQTNGADGLAYIRDFDTNPPPVDDVLPGQFWFDPVAGNLYIWHSDEWVFVGSAGDLTVETATVILSNSGPKAQIREYVPTILPEPDLINLNVQSDLNGYYYTCLLALEAELNDLAPVIVSDTKPDTPKVGQLWYDTETLDMSVWYDDGDSQQWVPVSSPFTYDEDLDVLRADLTAETRQREINVQQLYSAINSIDVSNQPVITTLQSALDNLSTRVTNISSTIDFTPYATKTELTELTEDIADVEAVLNASIASTVGLIPDVSNFVETETLDAAVSSLSAAVSTKTTEAEVANQINTVLVNNKYITRPTLDAELTDLSTDFLTHSGGTLTGSLTINKVVSDAPALDFSSSPVAGKPAFKFQTVSADSVTYSTFGTSDNFYEYAWKFDDKEDFCWVYADTNKVFSITKDGPACSQLYLADFGTNDVNGRVLHNKIDVRDRLATYQSAFETMRQGVTDATDFDSLKANILTALAIV